MQANVQTIIPRKIAKISERMRNTIGNCRDASVTPMKINNNVVDTSDKLKVENGKLKVLDKVCCVPLSVDLKYFNN